MKTLIMFLLGVFCVVAHAGEPDAEPKVSVQQTITVTRTSPDHDPADAASAETIQAYGGQDLAEGLRAVPGLAATRRGAVNLDPSFRGLHATQLATFVNGTRAFAAGPARMDSELSHVSLHEIQRVQLVKGPYALAWGAGALSALNVETFVPDFATGRAETHGSVALRYGDNQKRRDGAASFWHSDKTWRVQLFHNQRNNNDYRDGAGRDVPSSYETAESMIGFGLKLGASAALQYKGHYQDQSDLDYPGRLLDATYFKNRLHDLKLVSEKFAVFERVQFQVYSNHKDHAMNNDEKPTALANPNRRPPFPLDILVETESNTHGAKAAAAFNAAGMNWTLGADFYALDQTAARRISRRDTGMVMRNQVIWPDATTEVLGGYLTLNQNNQGFSWNATVRFDASQTEVARAGEFFQEQTAGNLDRSNSDLSGAVSVLVPFKSAWLLTLGAGSVVRVPTILERYADRFPSTTFQSPAEFVGDPELTPERANEINAALTFQQKRFFLTTDVFYRELEDNISYRYDPNLVPALPLSPAMVYRYINGTGATYAGAEIHWQLQTAPGLTWHSSASYTYGKDDETDEPAVGVAPLRWHNSLRYETGAYQSWGEVRVTSVAGQNRVAAGRMEQTTPGYTLFDVQGGCALGKGLQLSLGVRNLGDKLYVDHLNSRNPFNGQRVTEPGRSFFGNLSFRF